MTSQSIRVGGIDYLNALPLTRFLDGGGEPAITVCNHRPSVLATLLRRGELDVALAPAVEFLLRDDYLVVPGLCISSYGAVESIRLYHRKPLSEIRRVGLDTSSQSSALLVRLLFREVWRGHPRFRPLNPHEALASLRGASAGAVRGETCDAILLIGDDALSLRHPDGWEVKDLGTEWTRHTGLPFVYAFWIFRGAALPAGLSERLQEAKEIGVARVDDIVREVGDSLPGFGGAACRAYLQQTIQYEFGALQKAGLARFFSLCERCGIIPAAPKSVELATLDSNLAPD